LDLKLKSAGEMINHLITWGEVTRFELNGIAGAQDWITTFENAGILHTSATDIWSLSPEFWSLLGEEDLGVRSEKLEGKREEGKIGAFRTVLFQVPEYRGYLISILAEGAASAAKQGLHAEVEKWSGDELLPFLKEINQILDEIEVNGYRLVDGTASVITERFNQYRKQKHSNSSLLAPNSLSNSNQFLLGRTARPQDLFDFVLKRFVPYAMPEPCNAHGLTPALLPIIPLVDADGNAQFMNLVPAPWNVRRSVIQSGIALFDEHGKPMSDMGTADAARNALQDALIEQPFYKAVTQLAINHYRAKTASSPSFELVLQPGAGLSGVALFYETRKMGLLKDWLPLLVQCQECFAARPLEESQVENMMENLLALDILDQADDNLVLHEDFQSTLMAGRLRSVFRPGKVLQERMKELVVRRENEKKTEVRSEEEYRRIFTHKILTPNSSILNSSSKEELE
jgi:hypothetical protein